MTGLCHESTAAISEAAAWLVATPVEQRLRPTVPILRERFGLTPVEAVQAITEADHIRRGGAHVDAS
jgi:hypothetical protein